MKNRGNGPEIEVVVPEGCVSSTETREADAELIAEMRNALPALLAEREKLLAENAQLRAVVEVAKKVRETVVIDEEGYSFFEDELVDECENFDKALAALECRR